MKLQKFGYGLIAASLSEAKKIAATDRYFDIFIASVESDDGNLYIEVYINNFRDDGRCTYKLRSNSYFYENENSEGMSIDEVFSTAIEHAKNIIIACEKRIAEIDRSLFEINLDGDSLTVKYIREDVICSTRLQEEVLKIVKGAVVEHTFHPTIQEMVAKGLLHNVSFTHHNMPMENIINMAVNNAMVELSAAYDGVQLNIDELLPSKSQIKKTKNGLWDGLTFKVYS